MRKTLLRLLVAILALTLVVSACGSDDETTTGSDTSSTETTLPETSDATTAPDEPDDTTVAPAGGPDSLNIAVVLLGVQEEPWYSSMLDSLGRAKEDSPYGLAIDFEWFENVAFADGERVANDLASSGDYQMIIMHSTFSDAVAAIQDDYPDTLFAFSGSGNEATGRNGYWIDVFTHEPAYLAGIIAGMMTETDVIGGVAAFPFPNVNSPLNAYIEGAQSVNPNVTAEITYIESWFDPVKANESAVAQIEAGADMLYAERFGPFAAAQSAENVYAFGHFVDQAALAPDVVLASPQALWDPAVAVLIDAWYDHVANGVAYNAPLERIMFNMPEGGADISELSDQVPADVAAAVTEARDKILNGELVIEFNDAPVE